MKNKIIISFIVITIFALLVMGLTQVMAKPSPPAGPNPDEGAGTDLSKGLLQQSCISRIDLPRPAIVAG